MAFCICLQHMNLSAKVNNFLLPPVIRKLAVSIGCSFTTQHVCLVSAEVLIIIKLAFKVSTYMNLIVMIEYPVIFFLFLLHLF